MAVDLSRHGRPRTQFIDENCAQPYGVFREPVVHFRGSSSSAEIISKLSEEEMDHYRAPLGAAEDRRTMLNWPRQIPIAGEPPHIVAQVDRYADWLKQRPVPERFISADRGSIVVGRERDFCRTWPNQTEVAVKGLHSIQEDPPIETEAVASWLSTLPHGASS